MNRSATPPFGRLAGLVVPLAILATASPAHAGKLAVRWMSEDKKAYSEAGELSFVVDAHDESGPAEQLDKKTWGMSWGTKVLQTTSTVTRYRTSGIATSVLFLLPSTGTFVGRDEPDAGKDRSNTPLFWALDGLKSLQTSLDDNDSLAIGCYDEARAEPTKLYSGLVKGAASKPLAADTVIGQCALSGGAGVPIARLDTLLGGAVKNWAGLSKNQDAQRLVVVIVADGNSREPVKEGWWKGLAGASESRWLELYVIGLEDGGDINNLQALGKGGVLFTVPTRRNLSSELGKLEPWLTGNHLYAVKYQLDDPIRSKNAEVVLTVDDGKASWKSDPWFAGALEPRHSWLKTVLLIAVIGVSLVFVALLIRYIVQALVARRRRREEEEARRASQSYDGPSRGRLIVREGPAANLTFHLVDDVTYVGRSPDNHVSLPDGSVGKRHCAITIKDKSFQVEDLQSVNGVFVNGQKVLKAYLKDGDSIRLGSSEMQFRL